MLISGAFRVFIIDIFAGNVYDIFDYCSLVVSREVFFVSEGHLQNLPLAASYGCLATENPRHAARIYANIINSVHREACY